MIKQIWISVKCKEPAGLLAGTGTIIVVTNAGIGFVVVAGFDAAVISTSCITFILRRLWTSCNIYLAIRIAAVLRTIFCCCCCWGICMGRYCLCCLYTERFIGSSIVAVVTIAISVIVTACCCWLWLKAVSSLLCYWGAAGRCDSNCRL